MIEFWNKIPPDWRFALGGFFISRAALGLWSLMVYSLFPISFQNLDLFGEPLVTVFDLATSEGYAYSRMVEDTALTFQLVDLAHMADEQTGSVWALDTGQAVQGKFTGVQLSPAAYQAEDLFPYLGVEPSGHTALALWQRFDTNWYLKIASRGYDGSDGSIVYFPLYPLLIWVFALFIDPMLAAMLISNLALLGVLVLLYRLSADMAGQATARRAVTYLLVFPTAFFLTAAYTESLFLFFVLASFQAASRRHWGWSVFWSLLAALTRLQGFLMVLPLMYMLWKDLDGISFKNKAIHSTPMLIIPLATITFLAFSNLSLLNTYQDTLHARFVLPWENIAAAVSLLSTSMGTLIDGLNLLLTLGLIGILSTTWKKLPMEYFIYSLLMLLAPMFRMTTTQPLVSMIRYALAVFALFILLGVWGENRWLNRAILYSSVFLQLYLSAQFFLWGWVA